MTGPLSALPDGRFALNAAAELLRSDVPGSVRGYAIMQGEDWVCNAWGQALHTVRTGEPAFNHVYGMDLFAYLEGHAEAADTFNSGMTGRAASADVAVAEAYDFSGVHTIVDVGGGQMLIISGGRERTLDEHHSLLQASGFAPGREIPTASSVSVVEGIRV